MASPEEEIGVEKGRNESIRTIAVFFGATAIGLLSFSHDIYSTRKTSKTWDAVADLCFLVGFLSSLSVAAFRRPGENTRIADIILTFSFYVLLFGTMVFTWNNMRKFVAIVLTVVVAFLAMAYLIVKDPNSDHNTDFGRKISKYLHLAKP